MMVLFFKGGPGSGWHGPPEGTHLPSSDQISNLDEARAYWRVHLGGKTLPITVHSGDTETPINVTFKLENEHAFTADAGGRQKSGSRVFDQDRARAMSRIPQVISHPKRRIGDGDADLFLERRIGGVHYTIVLTWESSNTYRFSSAHFKPVDEVERLFRRQNPGQNKGPLRKKRA